MNVKFVERVYNYWITDPRYYSIKSFDKFKEYFFPDNITVKYSNNNFNAVVYDITLLNSVDLDESKINILVCVENCLGHPHYDHYIVYGDYRDNKIQIYFYNHIEKCVFEEKYIAIPVIYCQIRYFNKYYNTIKPSIFTPFSEKKLCILVTCDIYYRSYEKNTLIKYMSRLNVGACDSLKIHKNELQYKTCYHSQELLNVLQKYKFVIICENSLANGYITEKIFNAFFARCIPIYDGSKGVAKFIDKDSFINVNNISELDVLTDEIKALALNEDLFNRKVAANKINRDFNDEDYAVKLKSFIDTRLQK